MLKRLFVLAYIFIAAGCGAIPDIKPFADATVTMKAAIAGSYATVIARTEAVAAAAEASGASELSAAKANYEKAVADFRAGALARATLLSALVKYADALAAIADSGLKAEESVKAVSTEVQGLVSTFMANPIPAVPLKLAETLLAEALKIGALAALNEALENASPIVAEAVTILDADLENVAGAMATKAEALVAAYRVPFIEKENQRRNLVIQRDALFAEIAAVSTAISALEGEMKDLRAGVSTALPEKQKERAGKVAELAGKVDELRSVETALSSADRWYLPLQEKLAKARGTLRADEEMIVKARELLSTWVEAHRDLGKAVQEARKPNVRALVATTIEVRAILSESKEN